MRREQTEPSDPLQEKYREYIDLLRSRLSEKRFVHSLAVAKEARRLAKKYFCDEEKAYVAGLLHDICKDTPQKEQLQLFQQFDIILEPVEINAPKLWHAIAGANYLAKVLSISDEEIIAAVRYHTTARAGMGLLEKIIYLADFTSEDRDYDGVEEMRNAVDRGLDHAMVTALRFSVEDLVRHEKPVHPDTLAAFREASGEV